MGPFEDRERGARNETPPCMLGGILSDLSEDHLFI
jgi:hypothetical protein